MFYLSSRDGARVSSHLRKDQYQRDAYEVFVSPFLPGENFILLQNMGNTNELCMYDENGEILNAFNNPGPLSEKAKAICEVKDTRLIAQTRANTIISESKKAVISPLSSWVSERLHGSDLGQEHRHILEKIEVSSRDFILYLLESAIIGPSDLENLLFTDSFTDYDDILRKVAQDGRVVIPYNPVPGFFDLCRRYDVSVQGNAGPIIGLLGNKHLFREKVQQLRPSSFPYPRLWCRRGEKIDAQLLEPLIAYSQSGKSADGRNVLFIQKEVAGGGAGNYCIRREADGSFIALGNNIPLLDIDAIANFIFELDVNVEVTPFLDLIISPSIGIIISRQGVTCVGPFQQILNKHNDYVGFKLNKAGSWYGFAPDIADFLNSQMSDILELALELGRLQQQEGLIGYSSLDTLIYRDPQGQLALSYSEENVRYTGTCMLQMIVHSRPALQELLMQGELSLLHHDLVPLSSAIMAKTHGATTGIADVLRNAGIPLLRGNATHGVMLMAKPSPSIEGLCIGVAVIASNDDERDALFDQVFTCLTH